VHLNHLCPNPNLVDDSTPPFAELLQHYTKYFDTLIILRLKISCDKTLFALRHPVELVNIKLADVLATDVMLDIDDTEFIDWCKHINLHGCGIVQILTNLLCCNWQSKHVSKNLPIISMQHDFDYSILNQSFSGLLLLKSMTV
jgi:hypothetical protein